MQIQVRTSAESSSVLASVARRRIRFALGRFEHRVRSLSVRLTDVNGPRGGIDKRCLLTVRLDAPKALVVIEERDASAVAAISRAADRSAAAVARAVAALTDWRRTRRGSFRARRVDGWPRSRQHLAETGE